MLRVPLILTARACAGFWAVSWLFPPVAWHGVSYSRWIAISYSVGAILLWANAEWLAARVQLDQTLFEDLSQRKLQTKHIDAVLGRSERTLYERIKATLGLLRALGLRIGLLVVLTAVHVFLAGATLCC